MATPSAEVRRDWKKAGERQMHQTHDGVTVLDAVARMVNNLSPVDQRLQALDPEEYVAWRRAWVAGIVAAVTEVTDRQLDGLEREFQERRRQEYWRLKDIEAAALKQAEGAGEVVE